MSNSEEIVDQFLLTLVNISNHISNIFHENTSIGSGIFILAVIDSHENCIMTDIVDTLNIIPSTATRQVDSLVKQGLIKREMGQQDRRKVILTLTENGEHVYNRFKNHVNDVIQKNLESVSMKELNKSFQIINNIIDTSENQLQSNK